MAGEESSCGCRAGHQFSEVSIARNSLWGIVARPVCSRGLLSAAGAFVVLPPTRGAGAVPSDSTPHLYHAAVVCFSGKV